MSAETIICYWIGEEQTPPCPTLDSMPAYVDVVPLAFVTIDDNYQLNFDFLCKTHPASVIQEWIKKVRANGTKVLLSINDSKLGQIPNVDDFVANVMQNVEVWGVDGIDLDYEPLPFTPSTRLLEVTAGLRNKLGPGALITAPIFGPWMEYPSFLKAFSVQLDFLTTMDYTPYPGFDATTDMFNSYASAVGAPGKIAIGVSCMGPPQTGDFTPLDDVVDLCGWEPAAGQKKGAMLYTFSYDVQTRPGAGTGYPDGTFTRTIHEKLP